jgi:hypothetical protein
LKGGSRPGISGKDKDLNMMNMKDMDSRSALRPVPQRPVPGGLFPFAPSSFRLDGYLLSMASDIGALEDCLALERASSGRASLGSEGIQSPPAVPYCEFLTVRSQDGRLQAVCRLMRLDRDNPVAHPLKAGRFHLSPLLTALRYTREGVLEMGVPAIAPGAHPENQTRLVWAGMIRYLERNGLGFVIGLDTLPHPSGPVREWARLMDSHGLHPDLEVETRAPAASASADALASQEAPMRPPAGLQEALRRGCRLASEPAFNPASGNLEFVWVASRDMLDAPENADWRGSVRA